MKNKTTVVAAKAGNNRTERSRPQIDDTIIIHNHQQAAIHHGAAAKHHLQAVKHYEAGLIDKAAHSAVLAHGHHLIAGEFLNDNAKYHAQLLKQTNYQ